MTPRCRLYMIYYHIKTRCFNKKDIRWKHYGGRGITICKEWKNDYLSFKNWALSNGYKQNLSIDRIDNDGNYCPENCRWSTTKEQCNNKRNNLHITAFGETKTISEWIKDDRCVIKKYFTLMSRFKRGWEHQRIITQKVTQ